MTKSKKNLFLSSYKKKIKKINILCIGDIILDHYIYGKIHRISPEAPVPILLYESEKYELGGAGNVAKNISSLGCQVNLLSLYGNDNSSKKLKNLEKANKNIKSLKVKINNYFVPTKVRFINESDQKLRVDRETQNFKLTVIQKKLIIANVKKKITSTDLVVLSDYNKGTLDQDLARKIINLAKKNKKIVVADPKKINLSAYKNADIITPNQKELADAAGKNLSSEKELIRFSRKIIKKNNINNILITRSEKGMLLVNDKYVKKFKANVKNAIDVTGAGDTVVAVLSVMMALGLDLDISVKISNDAAGIVVKKKETANVSLKDLIYS
tara:strand:- start:30 stop:1010 length:981 start_codon:yes stop_codon:yes gene_type:complete